MMKERTETLRRRIALYRYCLQEGADPAFVETYLRQIVADEAELAEIEGDSEKRP